MLSFYSSKIFKAFCFFVLLFTAFQVNIFGQATFRITKPIIGTNQICSSTSNYYNNLSYAFSSNVTNTSGTVPFHFVELSNENGLISPREIGCFSPYVNVVYVGNIDINGQNLPAGNGYRIRVFSKSPSVYSEYGETFSILSSPQRPTLNLTGNVTLCPGANTTLSITNINPAVTYQWQRYSSNIASATGTSISVTTDGYYTVKATATNGCSIASGEVSFYNSSTFSSSLYVSLNNNYYGSNTTLFAPPNQPITLRTYLNGGKSPYNFTANDGTNNFSFNNVSYSKDTSLTSPSSGSKTYTLMSATDACGTRLTNSSMVRVRINSSNYCAVTGQSSGGIKDFSIQGTTINNLNSGKAADGWGEYLTPANINANVNYNFTIKQLTTTSNYFVIWADLNHNNVFDTDEKIFPTGNTATQLMTSSSFTGVLKLPSSTYNGDTRLRVMLGDGNNYYYSYPCQNQTNGETEDYVLRVFNGISPTTITTDSVPALGVCQGSNFSLKFTVTGTPPPANTIYQVEASLSSDFSNPSILGSGQSSPILCNTSGINYYGYSQYIRVVPTISSPFNVVNKSPNVLIFKTGPTAYLQPFFFSNWNNLNYYNSYADRNLAVANNSGPYGVFASVNSTEYPVSITLSDGRVLTQTTNNYWNNFIKVDSNVTANGTLKYKIVQTSNRLCTNNTSDSVLIRAGNPYLKIMKVTKSAYNDTTSISKLCGYFQVKFAGDFLDSLYYKFYHVQISDVNGSFNNPKDIGHVCIYKVLNEAKGGQNIECYIPTNLPPGTGYRLRVVKKTGNVVSPVFATTFEVLDPAVTTFTANLLRDVINEGEVTALNVNFSAGTLSNTLYLSSDFLNQYYYPPNNVSAYSINLGPLHGQRLSLSSYGGTSCGTSNTVIRYINVRTQDKDNSQWYIKPINSSYYSSYYYTFLQNLGITYASDTIFKRTFSYNYGNSQIFNSYYDFGSSNLIMPKSTLKTGETYSFYQKDNHNYNSITNYLTGIWIDTNQDGDFDDAGEELIKNQFNQPWNDTQNQNFTVPNNANLGFTRLRMRVMAKQNNAEPFDHNASNPIDRAGATYDIPIVILSNSVTGIISTPKISGNTLCNGNSFSIDYNQYGIPAGTNANVELSDASGNFGISPNVVGQGTTSTINVTLPLNMVAGSYKVRVVSNGIISPATSAFNVSTNNLVSMVDGDWHAGSTWSCGRIPTRVDDVKVSTATTVTVFSGDANVGSLITNGVLSFLNGTQLKFKVP
jgi:GEVED domain